MKVELSRCAEAGTTVSLGWWSSRQAAADHGVVQHRWSLQTLLQNE